MKTPAPLRSQWVTSHSPAVQASSEIQSHSLQGPVPSLTVHIQLKETMKSSANQSFNRDDDGAKPKSQYGDPS